MDKDAQKLASLISGVRHDIQAFGDKMLELLSKQNERLDSLDIHNFDKLNLRLDQIMASIDDVVAKVSAETSIIDSVITLIQGLRDQVAAAGVDPTKLQQVLDTLDSNTAKLSSAVTVNTPADPSAGGGQPAQPPASSSTDPNTGSATP